MENTIQKQLLSRRSVRKFSDKAIDPAIIEQIIDAGHQAPSSINGQQISLITVTDQETKQKLADVSGGTANLLGAPLMFIVVADFYRVNKAIESEGGEIGVIDSVEGFLTGGIDAGITVATLATSAESFGLGTTVIGGIRNDVQAVIDILGLPEYTIPMLGLIVGYPDMDAFPEVKPRIATPAYAFENAYKIADDYAAIFAEYERRMDEFRTLSGHNSPKYTELVTRMYGKKDGKPRDNRAVYEKQGFKLK